MDIEQRLDLERDDRRHESTQARLTGRLKFACCRECGGNFGMHGICREVLAMMHYGIRYVRWHKEIGNDEYLFCVCGACNRNGIIPDGFVEMTIADVQAWLDRDSMQPDYEETNNE